MWLVFATLLGWLLALTALVASGPRWGEATVPAPGYVTLDWHALSQAAEVFDAPERDRFRLDLRALEARCRQQRRQPAGAGPPCEIWVVGLTEWLARLVCPAVAAGHVATVESFLERVSRLVVGGALEPSRATYAFRLDARPDRWLLEGRRQPLGQPTAGAVPFGFTVALPYARPGSSQP